MTDPLGPDQLWWYLLYPRAPANHSRARPAQVPAPMVLRPACAIGLSLLLGQAGSASDLLPQRANHKAATLLSVPLSWVSVAPGDMPFQPGCCPQGQTRLVIARHLLPCLFYHTLLQGQAGLATNSAPSAGHMTTHCCATTKRPE